MRKDLYEDNFCNIAVNTEENYACYADMTAATFIRFSVSVGEYIAKRMKQNIERGYYLIDALQTIRTGMEA